MKVKKCNKELTQIVNQKQRTTLESLERKGRTLPKDDY